MLIIPAIDLRNGKCVRLSQGRKDAATVYDNDPILVAEAFEKDGAELIHVVDLDGAFGEGRQSREVALRIIQSVSVPVQFGGGLREISDVDELINAGAERVVIGTLAAESPKILERLVTTFGNRIVVGIDARDGQIRTHGWESTGKILAVDLAVRVAHAGVNRIIYTDVSRDGMLSGPNIEQTQRIARESGVKVTASGGISSLEDIERLRTAAGGTGIDSVIVGKALYEGRFTLREAFLLLH
ncbi:MAG TPA: 1-(5-phosphoribosyl)-5-[(5-phosphoribosylamino)methylideneamino]imidazole-4-carboxamide isomerase [Blastocatellia bacterium]|nr:1-(5-phosphoribosyl)-5-[(5-phosphoribosylamino)methylideneamino]imidazole-4-carboxamide isomerase [Blastocatellia bacterium]